MALLGHSSEHPLHVQVPRGQMHDFAASVEEQQEAEASLEDPDRGDWGKRKKSAHDFVQGRTSSSRDHQGRGPSHLPRDHLHLVMKNSPRATLDIFACTPGVLVADAALEGTGSEQEVAYESAFRIDSVAQILGQGRTLRSPLSQG